MPIEELVCAYGEYPKMKVNGRVCILIIIQKIQLRAAKRTKTTYNLDFLLLV